MISVLKVAEINKISWLFEVRIQVECELSFLHLMTQAKIF